MERDEESIPKDFPFPDDWKWASPHWHIAYHMTNEQYEYLLSLPLVLHIPTLHTMVVHAGLLPLNPKKSLTSKHQPLARIPVPPIGSGSSEEQLRTAQEIAVVKEMSVSRLCNSVGYTNDAERLSVHRIETHGLSQIYDPC